MPKTCDSFVCAEQLSRYEVFLLRQPLKSRREKFSRSTDVQKSEGSGNLRIFEQDFSLS